MTPEFIKIGSCTATASNIHQFDLHGKGKGTYKRFFLKIFNGTAAAPVANIKTSIATISLTAGKNTGNESILDKVTPTLLFMLELYHNSYKGLTANVAGELHIDPAMVLGLNAFDRRLYSLGTADLNTLTMDIQFGGTLTNVSRVELWAEYDPYDIQPLGAHIEIKKVSPAIATEATSLEITELPRFNVGVGICAYHIEQLNSSVVSSVEVKLNGKDRVWPDVPKSIMDRKLALSRRAPQSTWAHVDFSADDFSGSFLRGGMGELLVVPTFSTAPTAGGNLPIWVVSVKLPQGI